MTGGAIAFDEVTVAINGVTQLDRLSLTPPEIWLG